MLPRGAGLGRQGRGWQTVPGTRRSCVVVLLSPVDTQPTGVLDCGKQPSVEAPIAKRPVAALMMPVLPWAARVNAGGVNRGGTPPVRDLWREALRAMVTWHIPRHTAGRDPRLEHLDDITRGARPGALPGQPCTGLLIQHRQALQPAPLGGRVVDTLVAPDMVGRRGPGRPRRVRPDGAPRARWRDHLASRALPKAAPRVAPHGPRGGLQQGETRARPHPWRALREDRHPGAPRRPLRWPWLPPLGTARPGQPPAGAPCAHPGRLRQRRRRPALGSQAPPVLPRTSCRLRWSRVRAPWVGLGDVHAPTLAPPPRPRRFGPMLLATDVADVSPRRGVLHKSAHRLGRTSVAFPHPSRRDVLNPCPQTRPYRRDA
jgi:hypothetical protein